MTEPYDVVKFILYIVEFITFFPLYMDTRHLPRRCVDTFFQEKSVYLFINKNVPTKKTNFRSSLKTLPKIKVIGNCTLLVFVYRTLCLILYS